MERELSLIQNIAMKEQITREIICEKGKIQSWTFGKRHRLTAADKRESVPNAMKDSTAWPQIFRLMNKKGKQLSVLKKVGEGKRNGRSEIEH